MWEGCEVAVNLLSASSGVPNILALIFFRCFLTATFIASSRSPGTLWSVSSSLREGEGQEGSTVLPQVPVPRPGAPCIAGTSQTFGSFSGSHPSLLLLLWPSVLPSALPPPLSE